MRYTRMKINIFYLFVFCLTCLSNAITETEIETLVELTNGFGIALYKELAKEDENMVCSGYSVNTVLNMILAGAKSSTNRELRDVLGYENAELETTAVQNAYRQLISELRKKKKGYQLTVANSMWIQKRSGVSPKFKQTISKKFFGEEQEVDFSSSEATDKINNWVKKETKGKIPKLLEDKLDPLTRLVLVNAMYFKGTWVTKFDKSLTRDDYFKYNNGLSKKRVKMMSDFAEFPHAQNDELNAQILELPYQGKDVSMFIFLPLSVEGISTLQQELTNEKISEAIRSVDNVTLLIKIPKFTSKSSFDLIKAHENLGIRKIFGDDADLSGINGKRNLFVKKFIQKAIIEVSEEGTVAAAATAATIVAGSAHTPSTVAFLADHPFLYFIVHKPSGLHLFIGKYVKP